MDNDPKNINKGDENTPLIKWRNRRLMAWVSLIAMIAVTFIMLMIAMVMIYFGVTFPPSLAFIDNIVYWFYFAMTTVVFTYMGSTTLPFIGKNKAAIKVDSKDL